ncbi:MAG: hypothetical protein ABII12_06825 [Planctomycetota bacterium]
MWNMNAISAYILTAALLTLIGLVLVWQRQRTQKTIVVWLVSGLAGILLGSVASFAAVHLGGYELTKIRIYPDPTVVDPNGSAETPDGTPATGGGPPGMGGGRFGGPRPKRDLTSLVRKVELLTGDISLTLKTEQAASLIGALQDIETSATMTDEQAQAKHDEILAIFDDTQKARLDAVRPAFRRRGSGGASGGPGGGGDRDPDANPFQQEANSQPLASLRNRFDKGSQPAEKGTDNN